MWTTPAPAERAAQEALSPPVPPPHHAAAHTPCACLLAPHVAPPSVLPRRTPPLHRGPCCGTAHTEPPRDADREASLEALLRGRATAACRMPTPYDGSRHRPSILLPSHLNDLLCWGVIRPLRRSEPSIIAPLFLAPKPGPNGTTLARALYDARPQNALIDFCALHRHGRFRMLRPFHQILVGTGTLLADPMVAEVDFTSYFFQLPWEGDLHCVHALRVGSKRYAFRVGVQGGTLMPLVAQTVTCVVADAPSPGADPWDWVDAGVVVTYDNILIAAPSHRIAERWDDLHRRAAAAGVVIGDTQPPSHDVPSCGIAYDARRRRWRLADKWVTKVTAWLADNIKDDLAPDEERRMSLAGLAGWAHQALLLPLYPIRQLLQLTDDPSATAAFHRLITTNPWRRFRCTPSRTVPPGAVVVVSDGSGLAAGIVCRGWAHTRPWPTPRDHRLQQQSEWEAAAAAVELAAEGEEEGKAILLVADNTGILAALATGNARTPAGVHATHRIAMALHGPLWLAFVPSADNPADAPSRSRLQASWPTSWQPSLEGTWRRGAILAEWSTAHRLQQRDE